MMIIRRLILILIASVMVGCGSQGSPTSQPTIKPTATNEPEATATEAEATETVELPEGVAEGKILFMQFYQEVGFACSTCHYANSDNRLLGPGLIDVERRFQFYGLEVDSVEDYIKDSIVSPAAFVVPDASPYPPNIMPRNYGDIFSEEELDQLVAYILSF